MKKIQCWVALALALGPFSPAVFAQSDQTVNSKITEVTVFLSKAQVTREASARLDAGKTSLVFTGLTSQLDPQSIQVSGNGAFTILGTSHRLNYLNELNRPRGYKILKDSLDYCQKQIQWEQSQKEILMKEEQMLLTNQKIGGTNSNLTVAELKAMSDFYRSRLTDIVGSRMKSDDKIKTLNERMTRLQQQINAQNELLSRNTSEIVVNVSAEAASTVSLTLHYVVANAGWNAVYDVRAINTKNPLQLSYKATVYQGTGEDWKNVHLHLSTANPNLSGLKPELTAWYLDFYQPVVYEMSKSRAAGAAVFKKEAAEMREVADLAPAPAATMADFVQTVQTSLNTEFDIALPYTVSSSNQPTVVDIRNYEMKAAYQYAVVPKLESDAFLIAKATGWEEFSLLPGEANIFFEGTFVGKTFIDPASIKDTLPVSLGRDKRIVVKRERVKEFTSRKALGGSEKETFAFEISVRNSKQEAIRIVVEDQLPISQNSQIEVIPGDLGGGVFDKDTGKLTWTWTLQPSESKKAQFHFEIKHPKDKPVTGL